MNYKNLKELCLSAFPEFIDLNFYLQYIMRSRGEHGV